MSSASTPTIKSVVLDYLRRIQPAIVDSDVFDAIRREVVRAVNPDKAPSEAYLMDILHGTDVEVDRQLGGIPPDLRHQVKTATLSGAKRSLVAMSEEYARAPDATRAEDVRRAVRQAKDKLKLVLTRKLAPEKRSVKEEVLQWMLVWLENPMVFESWVAVRSAEQPKPLDGADDLRP